MPYAYAMYKEAKWNKSYNSYRFSSEANESNMMIL